jgi:DNA-damage-inducible protein J
MVSLQVRIDEQLRSQAQAVAQGMGIDLTAAVRIFLTQMVRENGLPFQPKSDPFYSANNQAHLAQVAADLNNGVNCSPRGIIEE